LNTRSNAKETGVERLALRPIETAEAMGLCRSQVYRMLQKGELPSIRIGRSVRVPVDRLKEWIERKAGANRAKAGTEDTQQHAA
jgi:excisionase family DNA binding protein